MTTLNPMTDFGKFYDRNGDRIDMYEWCRLHRDNKYKVLDYDKIGPWAVSTVWLGGDHNYYEVGPPIIFETMVFAHDGVTYGDNWCRRYSTEKQANKGHIRTMLMVYGWLLTFRWLKGFNWSGRNK